MIKNKILVIAGPTAAGKSHIALAIAQKYNAVIINADSMQVYAAIPVLSAQPSATDKATISHLLYGMMPSNETCSAGMWVSQAKEAIDTAHGEGKLPIIVGGTGLYLKALIEGLSPVPAISDSVRDYSRALLAELGNEAFHAMLKERDPLMAAKLNPGDSQRMARSLEVIEQTGISLLKWQQISPTSFYDRAQFVECSIIPPREVLYANCNNRFLTMLEQGALQEVEQLMKENLLPSLPVMKALGVHELSEYLAGRLTKEEAITQAQTATRHYAKRQLTWCRNQMPHSRVFTGREAIEGIMEMI